MSHHGISTLNLNKPMRPGIGRAPTSTNLSRPMPIHRLEGKVALITGGGGKVGVETAGRLLIEGANVALIDINQQSLEEAVPVLKAAIPTGVPLESRLLTIAADATREEDVEACVAKAVQRFGRLDCALLNAGEREDNKSLFDTSEADFEKIMKTNVTSAFLALKHVAKVLRDQGEGGSIVIRSSIAGLRGLPGLISYSSSKFALRGIALTAAEELGKFDIRVNTIHTSIIDTPGYKEGWSKETLQEFKHDTALGRFGSPDDVANVVAFLCSDDSGFMTGGHLKVDGGLCSI
jgi:NAD(P)-dependent dehydrogenase (short-subunit alcohol dehydrogenase family)